MRRFVWIMVVLYLLVLCGPVTSYGQENDIGLNPLQWEVGTEYITPTHENRQIDTASLNILAGRESSVYPNWSFYKGITITDGWGDVIRSHGSYVTYHSSARGIGPVFLARYQALQTDKLLFSFDMSGSLIFYNREFPAGGDRYNFMWRNGPNLKFKIDDDLSWGIGYQWMHVSNGQRSRNPSYEGRGVTLSVSKSF